MEKINILEEHAVALKEHLLCVPTSSLEGIDKFTRLSENEVTNLINKYGLYEFRNDELESNESLRQIVPYVLIRYVGENNEIQYASVQRTKKHGDQRLVGETYIGFGGHVGSVDVEDKALLEWPKREMDEEIGRKGDIIKKEFLGVIRDDSNPVGRCHLGLAFRIDIDNKEISLKEDKSTNLQWHSLDELKKMVKDQKIEGWSKIIIDSGIL